LKESRGLKVLKPSIFHSKKGKLDEKDMAKELLPIPFLPNDFEDGTKAKKKAQVEWHRLSTERDIDQKASSYQIYSDEEGRCCAGNDFGNVPRGFPLG
jgi:hypothetical protein